MHCGKMQMFLNVSANGNFSRFCVRSEIIAIQGATKIMNQMKIPVLYRKLLL